MKRMAPPARVRVEAAAAPPIARIVRVDGAIRLIADTPPAGATLLDASPIAPSVASPVGVDCLEVCAGGRILLGLSPGIARTFSMPDLAPMFDRRPVGIDAVVGATAANAGLLHADDGWRAVVLPSLGDRVAGLGPGPVAIRGDGRQVFVADGGAIVELQIADGAQVARHEGAADHIAVQSDGTLIVAVGSTIGPPGATSGDGAVVTQLVAASDADIVVARRADDTISVFAAGEQIGHWTSCVTDMSGVAVSADGQWLTVRSAVGSAVVRAVDGALSTYVAGAPALVLLPDGRLVAGGEWGTAIVIRTEEAPT